MSFPIFAMDTSFYHSLGAYEWDARCEMLRELGFDATYLTLWSETAWADLPRVATTERDFGLPVAGVYVTLDIAAPPDHAGNTRILRLVETLEGCSNVEISVTCGDPAIGRSDSAGDALAEEWLSRLLKAAEPRDLTLSLYPHINFWLERMQDAVRLCRRLDHRLLCMVFTGFHWYAVDGTELPSRLREAAPYLHSANICGSRRNRGGDGLPASLEPLDEGELDNFAVLGMLQAIGYQGMVGLQGYSVGGDVYTKLRRSLDAYRDIQRRLEAHPHWAQLRST